MTAFVEPLLIIAACDQCESMVISIGATNIADNFGMNNFYGNNIYSLVVYCFCSFSRHGGIGQFWLRNGRDHTFASLFWQICHLLSLFFFLCFAVILRTYVAHIRTKQCLLAIFIFNLIFALCARSNVFWPFYFYFGSSVCTDLRECFLFFLYVVLSTLPLSHTSKYHNQHHIRINAHYVCYCLSSFGCVVCHRNIAVVIILMITFSMQDSLLRCDEYNSYVYCFVTSPSPSLC